MKKYLLILGLSVLVAGIYSSCKKDPLEAMRENELAMLSKYVADNNFASFKDDSTAIYFKKLVTNPDATAKQIASGYKVQIFLNITLIDSTQTYLTTEDKDGRNYEPIAFYVDVNNATVNQNYVQQIAGLHVGLKKMKVGEKAFMIIPSELAFKALDYSYDLGIPRFSTLLVTVTTVNAWSPEEQKDDL